MVFFDILKALCKQRGVSVSAVTMACGLSNSTSTKWRKGATPESDTLAKLASYFGVSFDFLLGATPEAYLLWTEYQIAETKKALSKESDEEKRGELEAKLEALKESLEDQKMFSFPENAQQKAPPAGDGEGRYAKAFDGEENEVIAAREWLRRAADQFSPELVIQVARYLDIPEEAQQSAAHDLELVNQVRRNGK